MTPNIEPSKETEVVYRLLRLLMSPAPPKIWAGLEPYQWPATAAAYFLLDAVPGGDGEDDITAEGFVSEVLSRLLHELHQCTEQRQVTYEAQVRGRVSWSDTFKARVSDDFNPGRYVCREVHHLHDTLENQLVKYVVVKITQSLRIVPAALRSGRCYTPYHGRRLVQCGSTAERLSDMESTLEQLRALSRLREVTLPYEITAAHLIRAETSKSEDYATAARLYRRYQEIVLSLSWPQLVLIGRRMLPLPDDATEEGDPWIRLGAGILRATSPA